MIPRVNYSDSTALTGVSRAPITIPIALRGLRLDTRVGDNVSCTPSVFRVQKHGRRFCDASSETRISMEAPVDL